MISEGIEVNQFACIGLILEAKFGDYPLISNMPKVELEPVQNLCLDIKANEMKLDSDSLILSSKVAVN